MGDAQRTTESRPRRPIYSLPMVGEVTRQCRIGIDDTLGLSGGAGGENRVGGLGRLPPRRQPGHRTACAVPDHGVTEVDDGGRVWLQRNMTRVGRGVDDDRGGTYLGEDRGDPLRRQGDVDRYVRTARCQGGQDGHDRVDSSRQTDRHEVLRADSRGPQHVRQRQCVVEHFPVRQPCVPVGEGNRTRRRIHLTNKEFDDVLGASSRRRGCGGFGDQGAASLGTDDVDVTDTALTGHRQAVQCVEEKRGQRV